MNKYITYEDGVLKAICHIFSHKNGKKIHLLPVSHYGEKQFYIDLLEYIGDKNCLYEGMNYLPSNDDEELELPQELSNPKSLDQRIESIYLITEQLQLLARKEIRKFNRLIITGEVRKLRKTIKRILRKVDEKFKVVFYQCEKSGFRFFNISTIHNLIADSLGLQYQYNVIDYVNDIPNRDNWHHADILIDLNRTSNKDADYQDSKDSSSESVELLEDLNNNIELNYDPFDIQTTKENALLMYRMLILAIFFQFIPSDKKLEKYAQDVVDSVQQNLSGKSQLPTYLIEHRNQIVMKRTKELLERLDEIIVFYGALHMTGIEEMITNEGFSLDSVKEFEIFKNGK
jgi:hypothetical protein